MRDTICAAGAAAFVLNFSSRWSCQRCDCERRLSPLKRPEDEDRIVNCPLRARSTCCRMAHSNSLPGYLRMKEVLRVPRHLDNAIYIKCRSAPDCVLGEDSPQFHVSRGLALKPITWILPSFSVLQRCSMVLPLFPACSFGSVYTGVAQSCDSCRMDAGRLCRSRVRNRQSRWCSG